MSGIKSPTLGGYLNHRLEGLTQAQVVAYTVAAGVTAQVLYKLLAPGEIKDRALKAVFRGVRSLADFKIKQLITEGTKDIGFPTKGESEEYHNAMPFEGMSDEKILEISDSFHQVMDGKLDERKISGVVYRGTEMNDDLMVKIIRTHLWSNPIFADFFGATRKMEAEVSAMMLSMFNAPNDDHCCTYTLGGTESILLSMLSYANRGRRESGIESPEVVLGKTAHPAFDKAAFYFGIRLVKTDVDPVTSRMIPSEVEKHIGRNTVAIVGSAPNFHAGTYDDFEALAKIALKHNVGLHVDACVGGFLNQFMGEAGYKDHKIDFRIKGVTTISADIHKWGGAPKGSSIALFHSKSLRKYATFTEANYPGGLYVTPGVSGSRPGYCIAAAWATILGNGRKTYIESCRQARECSEKLKDAVLSTEGLELVGIPESAIVAFTSKKFDIYELMNRMKKKNWILNPIQFPAAVHLGITLEHAKPGCLDAFIVDLKKIAAELVIEFKDKPLGAQSPLIYGSTQAIPDRTIINDLLCSYVDRLYTNAPQPQPKEKSA